VIPTDEMRDSLLARTVMAGLGPAIHVFASSRAKDVDGRPSPAMTRKGDIGHSFGRLM
jgi:hypothetical protein